MGRPPVSIQSRQSKGETVYEVWVRHELVGTFPSTKAAHREADKHGGAPGWGKKPPPFHGSCAECRGGAVHTQAAHDMELA